MTSYTKIGGTPEAVDRWVLGNLPWSWCSLPTVYMHMGVHGQPDNCAKVLESLGRLVAAKKAGHKDKGLVVMYKRIKEN